MIYLGRHSRGFLFLGRAARLVKDYHVGNQRGTGCRNDFAWIGEEPEGVSIITRRQNEDLCGGFLPDVTEAFFFYSWPIVISEDSDGQETQLRDKYNLIFKDALTVLIVFDHSSSRYYTALTHMEGPDGVCFTVGPPHKRPGLTHRAQA